VEIFKQVSIDWLSKKWWFLGFSWLLIALGAIGYYMHSGLEYGIDFTGGTIIKLKFKQTPDLDLIRKSLASEAATPPLIQRYGPETENEVQIRMQTVLGADRGTESVSDQLLTVLRKVFDPEHVNSEQVDFNNIGLDALHERLLASDPDNMAGQSKTTQEIDAYYRNLAQSMLDYRNQEGKGLVGSLEDLKKAPGVSDAVITALNEDLYAGPFAIKGLESVGAIVGSDLRRRAQWAVGFSFLAMLVYIAFRFKPIYGVAAVIALFHDLAITIGLFALTHKEISLTVIAALLTLVGYSINDSIVVFDRVRENLRIMRKESLSKILDLSVNQTLARTIMTSGMTFLSVFALFVFGGDVLNGFSFALTVGIIIGTYSSIGIACPIVDWWYRVSENDSKRKVA
jgi:preprotein translocase subunit SecF